MVGVRPATVTHLESIERRNGSDAASLLWRVHDFLGRFVAYPDDHAHIAHMLWICHTHLMDVWDSTPRIAFLSPEPASGKSRALEVSELLVPRPVEAVNVSPAYLFRKVGDPDGSPTLLYDEIDTVFGPKAKENEEIRGLLNAGHRRGAVAGRCVPRGKEMVLQEFPAFCAVAMAGLGDLPDTLLTRSVVVRMRRRRPDETVAPFRRRIYVGEGHGLRDELAKWATSAQRRISVDSVQLPEGVEDRDADVWEALLAVAQEAGSGWGELARRSAVAHVAASRQDKGSLGVQLLSDLRSVFGDRDEVWTEDILAGLYVMEESPWSDLKGKPLGSRGLARYINRYGATSRDIRAGGVVKKGYARSDLTDAWERYLPSSPQGTATSATPLQGGAS